jgi:heavy metal sensor kinase
VTLTTRLTVFSLAALAVVLAGFSTAVYLLARHHLHRQADDRLDAALDVLTAAAEVKPDGIEWDPTERRLGFGSGTGGDAVVWLVTDPDGRMVDRSMPPDAADFMAEAADQLRATQRPVKKLERHDDRWLLRQRRIEALPPNPESRRPEEGHRDEKLYPALVVTVGTSLEPIRASLRELAAVLAGASVGVWVIALLSGRAVCRWALRPVTRMAASARGMGAADLGHRLPTAPSGDELEDLGRAFNGLLDRVQEAFERQRRFTAEASHQLRTPLTAVLGQVEVALRRDRDPEEYRRVLGAVQRQADRLRRIVDALLFLARADREAGLPDRQRVDLGEWLPAHVRAAWADHPRATDVAVDAAAAPADVHPVLLGEAVNVLVDNACKYSPAGTPVVVRVGPVDGGAEVSVTDSGWGIGEEDAARLFEPFVRSAEARRRGVDGLGLGLAVAKRIAEAHGGTLTVTSAAGKGSRFTLRLPGTAAV